MEQALRLPRWHRPRTARRDPSRAADPGRRRAAPPLGGPLLVLGSCASLQSSAALATTVFAVYGPVGTGALRFALAAPLLLLAVRPVLRGRSRRFWASAMTLGVALAGLNFVLYEALARATLGIVVTLQFLGPLAVALVGARRRLDVLWVAGAAAGVGLITGAPASGSPLGLLLAGAAAAITVVTLALSRRLASESAGLDGLAVAVGVAACVTLPAALHAAAATRTVDDVVVLGVIALLGLALPYGLEYVALRAVPVKTMGILLSLDPAIAALAGAVWLGQHLGAAEVLGIGLVVLASTGVTGARRSGPPPAARGRGPSRPRP
jgi:inner membrane transporter RhtA